METSLQTAPLLEDSRPARQVEGRVQSIDLLRGLVIVIMTLDHCRDFFHSEAIQGRNPLDFETSGAVTFMTRWVTHFCAPVFVMLAGTACFLYAQKKKSRKEAFFFLMTRGIWLVVVEVLVINPLWLFDFNLFLLQVIWAIGVSMIFLSFMQFLPWRILLFAGLAILFGHNLLDPITVSSPAGASVLWSMVHVPGPLAVESDVVWFMGYPFLPWLGIMILGYVLGRLNVGVEAERRKKYLLSIGWSAIVLFLLIRTIDLYGDGNQWQTQENLLKTIFDFIDTTKYPPSLLFALMTLGPAFLFLAYAESWSNEITRRLLVFGKVPFFYYILHVALIHSLALIVFMMMGFEFNELHFDHFTGANAGAEYGLGLWSAYLAWAIVVVTLYFPCRWYGRIKAKGGSWVLGYI